MAGVRAGRLPTRRDQIEKRELHQKAASDLVVLPRVVDVEQGEVVAVHVLEAALGLVRGLGPSGRNTGLTLEQATG